MSKSIKRKLLHFALNETMDDLLENLRLYLNSYYVPVLFIVETGDIEIEQELIFNHVKSVLGFWLFGKTVKAKSKMGC